VAVKVAEVDPAATVTEAGTLTDPLEVRFTAAPPVPALVLSVTVQLLELPGPRVLGLQTTPVTVGGEATTMDPPVAVMVLAMAVGEAPKALTLIAVVPTLLDIETENVATTPFPMLVLFSPAAKHV
jgi:hypothetical protein